MEINIKKLYLACGLQAINLTASTTANLVFVGGTKSWPVQWCPRHMEHLIGHCTGQLSYLSTIMPISHDVHKPLCQSAIMLIPRF